MGMDYNSLDENVFEEFLARHGMADVDHGCAAFPEYRGSR